MFDWSSDEKTLLFAPRGAADIGAIELSGARWVEVLSHPEHRMWDGRFSSDKLWVAFHNEPGPARLQQFVAPFRGRQAIPEKEWIPVTDGSNLEGYGSWSRDARLLYFISNRDSFRCVWAQPLDPSTKRPVESPVPVRHFHESRLSMNGMSQAMLLVSAAEDKLVFSLEELTGNIWMMEQTGPR